ncbi:MAG: hypothetical protein Sylvanvirus29_3 [Sylvanvirus sp.]|uniref:Uncharacterized protein n=1 Tax=Sylvanvirus sp. TaxID=2487774 RepID=A0A3G5AK99_9VIRU|nr:MAG: hypothetical protein Sylvanvirus29_3 [Sylvanvirus sp.]
MSKFFAWIQICRYLEFQDLWSLWKCRNKCVSDVLKCPPSWDCFEFDPDRIDTLFGSKFRNQSAIDFLNKFILHIDTWIFTTIGDIYNRISDHLKQTIRRITKVSATLLDFTKLPLPSLRQLYHLTDYPTNTVSYLSIPMYPLLNTVSLSIYSFELSFKLNYLPNVTSLKLRCDNIFGVNCMKYPSMKYITCLDIRHFHISWFDIRHMFQMLKTLKINRCVIYCPDEVVNNPVAYQNEIKDMTTFLYTLDYLELYGVCDERLLGDVIDYLLSEQNIRVLPFKQMIFQVILFHLVDCNEVFICKNITRLQTLILTYGS